MIRNIKPVEVSPTIKAARYIFLLLGIIYGATKKKTYKIIEEKAVVIRKQYLKEEHERQVVTDRLNTLSEIANLAKDFEIKELPPGWETGL